MLNVINVGKIVVRKSFERPKDMWKNSKDEFKEIRVKYKNGSWLYVVKRLAELVNFVRPALVDRCILYNRKFIYHISNSATYLILSQMKYKYILTVFIKQKIISPFGVTLITTITRSNIYTDT